MRSGDSEGTTSNQKNGKFRLSSPRIDMGTAITLLESYELTGFLRICMTMIGTLPEFHDFILPLVSLWNTQFLCVKFIADFSVIIMASFGHQISLCRQFTYWTIFLPTTPQLWSRSSTSSTLMLCAPLPPPLQLPCAAPVIEEKLCCSET